MVLVGDRSVPDRAFYLVRVLIIRADMILVRKSSPRSICSWVGGSGGRRRGG